MMQKKLSIIIPFRNEGIQIYKTIRSLNKWSSGELYDIICINDDSDDEFDYIDSLKEFPNVYYHVNKERAGVAGSRDKGVELAQTPYVLLLDGHMRFFKDVITPLLDYLEKYPRTLFCLQSIVLKEENGKLYCAENLPFSCGARICLEIEEKEKFLNSSWEVLKIDDYLREMIDIPCVLGAAYAIEKEYYQYLHGLNGLVVYGCDEAFLSMKVWLEGGSCKLLREWEAGHIYRRSSPCGVNPSSIYYNKMIMAELLLPDNLQTVYYEFLREQEFYPYLREFMDEQYEQIAEERIYLQSIFKNDFNTILNINSEYENRKYPSYSTIYY